MHYYHTSDRCTDRRTGRRLFLSVSLIDGVLLKFKVLILINDYNYFSPPSLRVPEVAARTLIDVSIFNFLSRPGR